MISEETDNQIDKQYFQFILKYISRPNSQININKDDFIILRQKKPEEELISNDQFG